MPRGDGTGPAGFGPMTGRAMGYCAGYGVPGLARGRGWAPGFGRGQGRGLGFGRAYGRMFSRGRGWFPYGGYAPVGAPYYPAPVPDDGVDSLVEEADYLKKEMEAINERLAEIDETVKKLKGDKDNEAK